MLPIPIPISLREARYRSLPKPAIEGEGKESKGGWQDNLHTHIESYIYRDWNIAAP